MSDEIEFSIDLIDENIDFSILICYLIVKKISHKYLMLLIELYHIINLNLLLNKFPRGGCYPLFGYERFLCYKWQFLAQLANKTKLITHDKESIHILKINLPKLLLWVILK